MKILSIQSAVAYGHVGNSAAVFPLQRIGVEVLPVYTVNFSNHTGYGAWRGPLIAPDDVREVVTGIEERGAFPAIDAVQSGTRREELLLSEEELAIVWKLRRVLSGLDGQDRGRRRQRDRQRQQCGK